MLAALASLACATAVPPSQANAGCDGGACDEEDCSFPTHYPCAGGGPCIDRARVCNGRYECPLQDDEEDCGGDIVPQADAGPTRPPDAATGQNPPPDPDPEPEPEPDPDPDSVPAQCYCDDLCQSYGDCCSWCTDTSGGGGDPGGGGTSCYCDAYCASYGDCCPDCDLSGGGDSSGGTTCYCDEYCTYYGDCCYDC